MLSSDNSLLDDLAGSSEFSRSRAWPSSVKIWASSNDRTSRAGAGCVSFSPGSEKSPSTPPWGLCPGEDPVAFEVAPALSVELRPDTEHPCDAAAWHERRTKRGESSEKRLSWSKLGMQRPSVAWRRKLAVKEGRNAMIDRHLKRLKGLESLPARHHPLLWLV